jgi:hypothetical protein
MPAQVARFKVKVQSIVEFGQALKRLFSAVQKRSPKGILYSMWRSPDDATYIGLLELNENVGSPLPALPEARPLHRKRSF